MSYQFEDDSALEELLNQQLDRRKQRPPYSDRPAPVPSSRPSSTTTKPTQRSSYIPAIVGSRPSTAINSSSKQFDVADETQASFVLNSSSSVPKSKLASWLDGKASRPATTEAAPAEVPAVPDTAMVGRDEVAALESADLSGGETGLMLEDTLGEQRLQEMSKQRLIKLITGEILPKIKSLRQLSNEQSASVVARLKDELQFERNRVRSLEMRHMDQSKLAEAKWMQLNRQLESRLEMNEHELSLAGERHRSLIVQLEAEHKQQIDKLREGYQAKLADEKLQFQETLRRREELHTIELESRLKVNCDLVKLETVFDEWHKMIQTTIRELDLQFKSVEGLLDKQTLGVNGTNLELAKRTRELCEHYERFESQGEQLGLLAREMSEILPSFSRCLQENESMAKQTGQQLEEFLKRNDQLRTREQELEAMKDGLASERVKLGEDRFELALNSNRLNYKEERLAEMVQSNELLEGRLTEQRREQVEQAARLEALQSSLDSKSQELKQQNYDLHLTRKKLTEDKEELGRLEFELVTKQKSLQEQLARVQGEGRKLIGFRDRARKELNQLRRLQKSLVCSLCLDRLFKGGSADLNYRQFQVTTTTSQQQTDNKWSAAEDDGIGGGKDEEAAVLPARRSRHQVAAGGGLANFELELAKLSRYIELDSKQLEVENKYVELLSIN